MTRHMPRLCVLLAVLAASYTLLAALEDFERTEIANYNGNEGLTLVTYYGVWGNSHTGRAWIVKADLSYGYRITTRCGDKKGKRATVGAIAEEMLADGVEKPLCGINADYFFMKENYNQGPNSESMAVPVGFCISDSRLAHPGGEHFDSKWNAPWVPGRWFFMETADHQLVHAVPDATGPMSNETFYVDGYGREITAHRPIYSWSMTVGGKKIRNAVQTGWCNYPVRNGQIYIIGNGQDRKQYPRVMVGIGKNALGHDQVAFFLNDGRHAEWSYGVTDEDGANMMIAEGCTDVGEFDGGGSAQMWAAAGADSVFPRDTTANGGYLNRADGSSLRKDATAIFILKPRKHCDDWEVGGFCYETEAEARLAAAEGEEVRYRWTERTSDAHYREWFAGEWPKGSVRGGDWTETEFTNLVFTAAAGRPAQRARLVTAATFSGFADESALAARLDEFAAGGSYPHGAAVIVEGESGAVWRGLVRERGTVRWKPLIGAASLKTPYLVVMDLDLKGVCPRIRYLVSTDGVDFTILHDDEGESWFDCAAESMKLDGIVRILGAGEVRNLRCITVDGGTIWFLGKNDQHLQFKGGPHAG